MGLQESAQPPLRPVGAFAVFNQTENPFRWMSEAMDVKKELTVFRNPCIKYQSDALN
jgi:hypothetical protein